MGSEKPSFQARVGTGRGAEVARRNRLHSQSVLVTKTSHFARFPDERAGWSLCAKRLFSLLLLLLHADTVRHEGERGREKEVAVRHPYRGPVLMTAAGGGGCSRDGVMMPDGQQVAAAMQERMREKRRGGTASAERIEYIDLQMP